MHIHVLILCIKFVLIPIKSIENYAMDGLGIYNCFVATPTISSTTPLSKRTKRRDSRVEMPLPKSASIGARATEVYSESFPLVMDYDKRERKRRRRATTTTTLFKTIVDLLRVCRLDY